jgi:hypothetical protein
VADEMRLATRKALGLIARSVHLYFRRLDHRLQKCTEINPAAKSEWLAGAPHSGD